MGRRHHLSLASRKELGAVLVTVGCGLGWESTREMLQSSSYSLVLALQFLLLAYDLFVNAFSELLRMAPLIQLVLFIIQDIAVLFNVIIVFLMFFNTFVFQAGLVSLLFRKFKSTIVLTATYFALSVSLHVWVMVSVQPWTPQLPGARCPQSPQQETSAGVFWAGVMGTVTSAFCVEESSWFCLWVVYLFCFFFFSFF